VYVSCRFTWILAPLPDGGGASNDPELLQALFNAAAGLCKVLVKHIAAALPAALKYTKGGSASSSSSGFDGRGVLLVTGWGCCSVVADSSCTEADGSRQLESFARCGVLEGRLGLS
jgi:hypothetical protein